ncbi:rhodanese-like domain-containing protein [Aerococcaceae bacterium NML190073]|nr:rhodanese-like domain-containing protein [Aerococcaceae bacterium NML190073]
MVKSEIVAQLKERIINKTLNLIDVREQVEYAQGHVPGAVNMPLSNFESSCESLSKDKTYHIICQSGGRSVQAAAYLSNKGYDVVNVVGGTSAWTAPLERGCM